MKKTFLLFFLISTAVVNAKSIKRENNFRPLIKLTANYYNEKIDFLDFVSLSEVTILLSNEKTLPRENGRFLTTDDDENLSGLQLKAYYNEGKIYASVKSKYPGSVKVFLVNEQGIEVYKSNGFLQPGSNKMILPVRYQSGTYYVKIISSSSKASIKVYVLE